MPAFSTPDVYVREIKVFPPSVAEVESAIPAFVGYTEKARRDVDNDLVLKPTKIYSMTEFEQYFGGERVQSYAVRVRVFPDHRMQAELLPAPDPTPQYLLHHSLKMFFDNGGGQCYIVSAGLYPADPMAAAVIDLDGDTGTDVRTAYGLRDGLNAVALEDEPTLLVIPDAVKLDYAKYKTLTTAMLDQCATLLDRFAILDVLRGSTKPGETIPTPGGATATTEVVLANRDAWTGTLDTLKYGAAYYPDIRTTLTPAVDEARVAVTVQTLVAGVWTDSLAATLKVLKEGDPAATVPVKPQTEFYNVAKAVLDTNFLVLPPSGAVTGVYAATDTNRGVWKAPANVPLANVLEPMVKISQVQQGALNVDPASGKSVNALRAFAGKGTLVWGARTLAGNDNEWRYVNVRRFFNMVEESVKKSTYWAVFESNDANTWVKVRGMIEAYLTQKWREGALAGATPKDAFFVRCGLGTTMDAQDILEGRMNVEIGMAVVRPAEFIILKFSHKLQTS